MSTSNLTTNKVDSSKSSKAPLPKSNIDTTPTSLVADLQDDHPGTRNEELSASTPDYEDGTTAMESNDTNTVPKDPQPYPSSSTITTPAISKQLVFTSAFTPTGGNSLVQALFIRIRGTDFKERGDLCHIIWVGSMKVLMRGRGPSEGHLSKAEGYVDAGRVNRFAAYCFEFPLAAAWQTQTAENLFKDWLERLKGEERWIREVRPLLD